MKTLIVYDSLYGNTEKIARAIDDALEGEVKVLHVSKVAAADLTGVDMLIVGSPTHGGRPSPAMQTFLTNLSAAALKGIKVAAFDTGISAEGKGFGLKFIIGVFGYAAGRIAKTLTDKGGTLISEPMGFFVEGKEGPLEKGELEKAKVWAASFSK